MTKRLFCAAALCMAGMLAVSAQSVRFNNEGKLKIVQFTDIHWRAGDPATADAAANMNRVLDEEKPDLVVYTGDVTTAKPATEGLDKALEPVISRGLPYAITFGNHDDEQDLTRPQLYDYVKKKQGCLDAKAEGTDFAISVTSADGKQAKAVIYVMDSNAYSTIDSLKGYGWFRRDQIDWYARKSAELTAANGASRCRRWPSSTYPSPSTTRHRRPLATRSWARGVSRLARRPSIRACLRPCLRPAT